MIAHWIGTLTDLYTFSGGSKCERPAVHIAVGSIYTVQKQTLHQKHFMVVDSPH